MEVGWGWWSLLYILNRKVYILYMKKSNLTKFEERLLMYPPSKDAWKCDGCKMIVPGSKKECNWCRSKKPQSPKLIYPLYLTACEKVGILPGSCRWRYKDNTKTAIIFPKDGNKWIPQLEK